MLESKSEPSAMCHETGFWFWKKTDCWSTTNSWFEIKNTAECALHEGEIQVILRDRSGEDFELGGEYFGEWNSGENRGRFDCFSGTEKISIVITAREGNAKFVLYGCPENGDQSFPKRVPFD